MGDLFKISKGKKCEGSEQSQLRYIQIDDLRNDNNLKVAALDSKNVLCDEEDILIAWDGANAGTVGYGLKGAIGSTLAKLVPITNKVFTPYAGRFLQSKFKYLRDNCTGATIPHISKPSLINIQIPLPPLAEQQKIAAILDAADSLRQKDQQLIDHYTTLSQSLFLEMFGDPVTNPMGWELERFDSLVSRGCPLTYGIVQPGDEYAGGVAIVRPVDLKSRYIKKSTLKRIDPEISDKFQRTVLKGGELLLSVRGSVGVVSIALPELSGANVTRGIVPIWMDTNKISTDFTFNLIQTTGVQRKIKALAKGATLIQINLKDLREMEMINPPIALQNQFAERIKVIEAQKQQARASLKHSEALFNSLLQRAFSGELTSSEAD